MRKILVLCVSVLLVVGVMTVPASFAEEHSMFGVTRTPIEGSDNWGYIGGPPSDSKITCPGGVLIVDDVNRYLPSNSRSPRSRKPGAGPLNEIWSDVAGQIAPWRSIWTSSGISDTAFYFKPCGM